MSGKRAPRWKRPECSSGKIAYRSQGATLHALKALRVGNAQSVVGTFAQPQGGYRCRECGAWHLTSRPVAKFREAVVR